MQGATWKLGDRVVFRKVSDTMVEVLTRPLWPWSSRQTHQLRLSAETDLWFWEENGLQLLHAPKHIWNSLVNALEGDIDGRR